MTRPDWSLGFRHGTGSLLASALLAAGLALANAGCASSASHASPAASNPPAGSGLVTTAPVAYTLNTEASGLSETVNNIANLTVVSTDANVLKAEYQAGFVQGHLQGSTILQARDNTWLNMLFDPPSATVLAAANNALNENFTHFTAYLKAHPGTPTTLGLTRQLFRMLGIYHGATLSQPANLDFSGAWIPDTSTFSAAELQTSFGAPTLTFMDVYFINAAMDLESVLASMPSLWSSGQAARGVPIPLGLRRGMQHCSAFVKRIDGDILMAHTTWAGFWDQSMAMTLDINGDGVTMNTICPGQLGSVTDFGYNNKGILFNETTNGGANHPVNVDGVFIFWRAALAEECASSLDDFFADISLDNTGTYLNAYMVVDSNTGELGLADMSASHFVFLRSSGGPYTVTTLPAGGDTGYDATMVDPAFILGYNYPPTTQCREDLQAGTNTSPERTAQLEAQVPGIQSLAGAQATITFFDPTMADSIMSRYDLTLTGNPIPYPFGAIDAKVCSASMAQAFKALSATLDANASASGFWMRFGTASYDGSPFAWSRSPWPATSHPGVPDSLAGTWTRMNLHLQ